MSLKELRQRRAAVVAEMRSIVDAASGASRDLTDDERKKFDGLKADNDNLERRIADEELVAEAERRMEGRQITERTDERFDVECRSGNTLLQAVAAQMPNSGIDPGRAREISQECARRSGRTPQGLYVPMAIFQRRVEERVLTTAAGPGAGAGGALIPTETGVFIDLLRAALVTRRLGATILTGLSGNLPLPRRKTGSTVHWVAENAAITASDQEFEGVSMAPKHAGCIGEYSRNMILQSSPDVEQLFRSDMAAELAEGLDKVAILGGGTSEPTGILKTTGIGSVALGAAGDDPTWDAVLDLIAAVDVANALAGSLGFLTNAKAVRKMRSVLRTSADTASTFIMENADTLAGYRVASTSLVPSNLTKDTGANLSALIFGNFADLVIGYWSELDILVNPFESTAYSKGNVSVRAMLTADIALRQPKSFAAIQDMVTTTA